VRFVVWMGRDADAVKVLTPLDLSSLTMAPF